MDLEIAQKDLESFCYSVSHDLRAPLRCIDGFSNALLLEYGGKIDSQGREYLQRIVDSCRRMALLIEELLVLSRIQRAEVVLEEVNLAEVARTVVARLQGAEPGRKVAFSIPKEVPIIADKGLITTVMEKLLENAWKFTRKSAGPVIELLETKRDSARIFVIRDNGVGFDTTYSSRLFKAFQRLHSQADYPGTGTGLALARAIILRHRGRIWAESKLGAGTSIHFTIGRQT